MNIKSLLLGSAAALAVVSGAQAADAIVAAEPEPMEYVKVCDAFGTGYFYIPGTETCLKIGGSVRAAVNYNEAGTQAVGAVKTGVGPTNYKVGTAVRARLNATAKNDSELGTIGSYFQFQVETANGVVPAAGVTLDQAYITVGGFKVGYFANYVDDIGIAGEGDAFVANSKFDSVNYTYDAGAFQIGLGLDNLVTYVAPNNSIVGIEAMAGAKLGDVALTLWGAYDTANTNGLIAGKVAAPVGPGTFELYGAWADGASTYATASKWTVGAAYALKATDALTITPSFNYFEAMTTGAKSWSGSLYAEYAVASGLTLSADAKYTKAVAASNGTWTGFLRLERSF